MKNIVKKMLKAILPNKVRTHLISYKAKAEILMRKMFMYLCRIFPVDSDKAVFMSFQGKSCSDSPKAIFREMVRMKPDGKYVWLMCDNTVRIKHAATASPDTFKGLYHLATAKLWVDNMRKEYWIVKRGGQYYVQTWHGNVALKKVEKDTEKTLNANYIKSAKNDSKMADLFLSGTKWRTQNYRSAFWYKGEILELGYPYSDVLYGDKNKMHLKIVKAFSLPAVTKLCIYAPTFRRDENISCYDLDFEGVLKALKNRFSGEWKLLIRLHPNVRNKHELIKYNDDILDASLYKEMSELALGVDFLISDYSSSAIDALEAHTHCLLYASDYDEYSKDRSMYFAKDELPFTFCETNDKLISEILSFDEHAAQKKAQQFYDRVGFFNGPDSAKKVTEYILKRIGE